MFSKHKILQCQQRYLQFVVTVFSIRGQIKTILKKKGCSYYIRLISITDKCLISLASFIFISKTMNNIHLLLLLAVTLNCLSLQTHDAQDPKYSSKLTLQFSYAVTDNVPMNSASFQVYWNDKLVADIKPTGYSIHTLSIELRAKVGRNVLAFLGTGFSDGKGSAITNVKLLRKSSFGLQDLIDNGDFKSGWNKEDRFRVFEGSIEGWKGKEIEVGNGQLYNRRWPKGTVVSELDADQNTRIQQVFYFLDNFQVFYQIPQQQFAI